MPFAFLDLDLLEQNIRKVVALAQGKRVRLASKSLRSVAVIRRIFEADPCFQGIMCYTAQEAAYLASQGFDDLLIGYPTWNEQDIVAIARATAAGTHITLMVDSTEHVKRIETVAAFVIAHKEKLDALNLDLVCYNGQIDFDKLSHPEIIRVIQTFPGAWNKTPSSESSGTRIDYVSEFDGMKIRCWAGEPPPSCKIVEETVEVPAQPATTKTVRKLVCADRAQAAIDRSK